MSRLILVTNEQAQGVVKETFDTLQRRIGKVPNILRDLGNSPAALQVYTGLSAAMKQAALTAKERESIALLVTQLVECDYCLSAHSAAARSMGFTEPQILDLRRGTPEDSRLRALADFTRAVVEQKGHVTDDQIAAFRQAGFTDGHIAEVVAAVAQNLFTSYFNHIAQPELDYPAAAKL